MIKKSFFAILALCLLAVGQGAIADPKYPDKPVTLIVPFPAGGGTDATMRAFAASFQQVTGQPMVIDNRPGGGTMIALSQLKSKPADGYTLGTMSVAHFTQFWLNGGKAAVHPLNDFAYLAGTHGSVFALVTRADSPISSLADVVKYSKANPDKPLSFGFFGAVPGPADEFAQAAGIKITHVPFKGEADAQTAVLGGHVDATLSSGTFMPYVESGKMKVIALTGPKGLAKYPNWQTIKEQGYDVVLTTQIGIAAPSGISPQLTERIESIVREVTSRPDFIAAAERLYQPVQFMSTKDYQKFAVDAQQRERERVEKYYSTKAK